MSSTSSCSNNINILYNNQFKLVFGRGTNQMELMCQKANIPGIKINEQNQPTTLGTTIPIPTMGVNFDALSIEFIVDSDLTNWKSLYSWIRNISNIANDTQYNLDYQDWHFKSSLYIYDPLTKFSTGSNQVCNSILFAVNFKHIIPVSLSGINFQSDSADLIPQKASCSFKYSHYEIVPDAPNNLG
tara:strand:+ start:3997 stop:4554 length:558 start_codon:yes stop_codon:yes gene_type:complete